MSEEISEFNTEPETQPHQSALPLCQGDLAELRRLVASGQRRQAAELLQCMSLRDFAKADELRVLGELCAALGYVALAGRWWYFAENKTPEMNAACREFEACCGDNAALIIETLGERLEVPACSDAQRRYAELQSRAEKIYHSAAANEPASTRWKRRAISFGCIFALALGVICFVVGAAALVDALLR